MASSTFKDEPLRQLRILYSSFVTGLFAAAEPGNYHWSPGDDTEIWVTDEHPVKVESIGARPCVSFTRSAVQFYTLGQDDMLNYKFDTGQKTKAILIPGTMSINCCSRSDLESESIAWKIAEHLWLLRELLIGADRFFEIGRQPVVSPPSPAEGIVQGDGADEWYCTTVSSPFQFPRKSQVTPLNRQILNQISMNLQLHLRQGTGGIGGSPASPTGVGLPFDVRSSPAPDFANAADAGGRTPDPGGRLPSDLPRVAHPLDPGRIVTVRSAHPNRPGLRPPAMGGRTIPIATPSVEESRPIPPYRTRV